MNFIVKWIAEMEAKKMLSKLYTALDGYKTYLAAILAAVFGVLATTDWVAFSNDPKTGLSIVGMAVLMAVMRAITQATTVKKAKKK